jgi:2-iminobutanoate/2-iminopropanoate deaminase
VSREPISGKRKQEQMAKRRVIEIPGIDHGHAPIPMAVRIGNMVFSSGIHGKDPKTHELAPEPERQAELMFQHIRTVMEMAGGTTDDIAHMMVRLADDQYRELINTEWIKMFPDKDNRPARHIMLFPSGPGLYMQTDLVAVLD